MDAGHLTSGFVLGEQKALENLMMIGQISGFVYFIVPLNIRNDLWKVVYWSRFLLFNYVYPQTDKPLVPRVLNCTPGMIKKIIDILKNL